MNLIDLIVLVVALIGFILGYKDGFLRKLIGFIGFILAILFAALFKEKFGKFIESTFTIEYYFAEILAGILIFFTTILIFSILKRIIHPFDKINSLVNKLVGGFIGSFQILFFLSAVFLLLDIFEIPDQNAKKKSFFYDKTYSIIPYTFDLLKGYTPNTEKIIKDFIMEKDTLK
ncbi:MAG: CvpA family protein [Ignavibacterium sp.]|nr:CvpA family protein [Ignavibacterium sp.]MCX7611408.1 CvpA family protein [Ignavibacterium sp.]MDW8375238.1 CvpA family protein [Ignavibacteriales bacterium]